jgi:hypothetical protein
MILFKILAIFISLVVFVFGALQTKTEIGFFGFLGLVISLAWLLIE